MGKHSRHYTDLNPLEGGGSGGGGKSAGRPLDAEFYMPASGAALVTAGMAALGAKNDAKRNTCCFAATNIIHLFCYLKGIFSHTWKNA